MDSQGPILVVEDDPPIAAGIVRGLKLAGFQVTLATDGYLALEAALKEPPALVVLDLNLPGPDGFALLEAWHHRLHVPIIVLSARQELEARLRSFGLGAADYLAKPFWMEELLARIRARLRLPETNARRVLTWADVRVDLDARSVTREDQGLVPLTRHELDVLLYLVERPGRALTREQIADQALPLNEERDARTVDSHVARIRKKLGPAGARLRTAWGIGYRFDLEDAP
ncbi:response regulator transcription factor [Myxococcus sp. MISCRS1]|uniref:response regulator transcription factor n=1 Tax=Myxococcus sp. MISCRS1 TaxID=2996786 RepID=UPI00226D8977|nr:response regulator transcription factor [Myxococcus sp. MISCRS1]MCY0997092.1 response regulator transcription factor [Myxococcus sp. MISCRS1]